MAAIGKLCINIDFKVDLFVKSEYHIHVFEEINDFEALKTNN